MARAPAIAEIEELPEADRLGDFPHPRNTRALFGQTDAERALAEALASGRMHHAWLLAGPKGIGKATLAYRFARAALAQPHERDPAGQSLKVDDATIAARQVRALSHPGLLVVRRPYDIKGKRFASSIPVDEVRRLRTFLGHRAAGDGWRVVIVDDANELNVNAANALLKSLEEPPERTVFLLVSPAPGDLVPTIRSRCRMLSMPALADGDLRAAATAALGAADMPPPADADWAPLERLSGEASPASWACSAPAASRCRPRSTVSWVCCHASTGKQSMPYPTSYNPPPPSLNSSYSSSCLWRPLRT